MSDVIEEVKKLEAEEEASSAPKYLRTLLRSDVYSRLKDYAISLATGQGNWDFGVAIERLLDNDLNNQRLAIIEARLDELELAKLKVEQKPKPMFLGRNG